MRSETREPETAKLWNLKQADVHTEPPRRPSQNFGRPACAGGPGTWPVRRARTWPVRLAQNLIPNERVPVQSGVAVQVRSRSSRRGWRSPEYPSRSPTRCREKDSGRPIVRLLRQKKPGGAQSRYSSEEDLSRRGEARRA